MMKRRIRRRGVLESITRARLAVAPIVPGIFWMMRDLGDMWGSACSPSRETAQEVHTETSPLSAGG